MYTFEIKFVLFCSIVNGRLGEDHGTGKFTCYNSIGASVIDYLNVLNTLMCVILTSTVTMYLYIFSIVCNTGVNRRDERSSSEE